MSAVADEKRRSEAAGHELRDVSFRPVMIAAAGLSFVLILVLIGTWALFTTLAAREARESSPASPLAAESARELPPRPRLQAAPIDDLRQLREAEEKVLTTYAWSNAKQGLVRIPIERAMDLLAARGIHPKREEQP